MAYSSALKSARFTAVSRIGDKSGALYFSSLRLERTDVPEHFLNHRNETRIGGSDFCNDPGTVVGCRAEGRVSPDIPWYGQVAGAASFEGFALRLR
jgi:hypothetical protein